MDFSDIHTPFTEIELREIEVLTGLLAVLSKGVVKPNDATHVVKKMLRLQEETDTDLTELINCCPASNVVYEAKTFIPLREKVLAKIESKFN